MWQSGIWIELKLWLKFSECLVGSSAGSPAGSRQGGGGWTERSEWNLRGFPCREEPGALGWGRAWLQEPGWALALLKESKNLSEVGMKSLDVHEIPW